MTYNLTVPNRDGTFDTEVLELENNSVVIVGANGSGKSRFGSWIDLYNKNQQSKNTHRIPAQKRLQYGRQEIQLRSPTILRNRWRFGDDTSDRWNSKGSHRWRNSPATFQIEDFTLILGLLLSEDYRTLNLSRGKQAPKTAKDRVEDIWNTLFSHRKMQFNLNTFEPDIYLDDNLTYSGAEMSDGERVALYLIVQCLLLDDGITVIVDEPENHLHKAIINSLWDEIEQAKPNNLFIYITHDLDFAVSRKNAPKIWIQSYNNTPRETWLWEELEPIDDLPESLLLKVLGSRKPVLFVEAKQGDWDSAIYGALFPNRLIIPVEGSREVKKAVKSLKMLMQKIPSINHIAPMGLIDRDYNSDQAIQQFREDSVYCLDVAEVENLFCIQGVIEAIAKKKNLEATEIFNTFKAMAFEMLEKDIGIQATKKTSQELEVQLLDHFNSKHESKTDLVASVTRLKDAEAMLETIYTQNENLYNSVIKQQDYDALLKHYNNKGLPSALAPILGLYNKNKYMGWVIRILRSQEDDETKLAIREAIKPYLSKELQWD